MDNPVEKVDNSSPLHPCALGIFAKAPVPGQVKTRLCPPFSPQQAAVFHRLALAATISRMRAGAFDLVLFHAGGDEFFRRRFPFLTLKEQVEGDLGTRMDQALRHLLIGRRAAALIGADTPDLPLMLVHDAFAALQEKDFVTAPARDGGYVLVGTRRPCPQLFRNIAWSTPRVLPATRRLAAAAGIAYAELAPWEDADDAESVQRLIARVPGAAVSRFASRVLGGREGQVAGGSGRRR